MTSPKTFIVWFKFGYKTKWESPSKNKKVAMDLKEMNMGKWNVMDEQIIVKKEIEFGDNFENEVLYSNILLVFIVIGT